MTTQDRNRQGNKPNRAQDQEKGTPAKDQKKAEKSDRSQDSDQRGSKQNSK